MGVTLASRSVISASTAAASSRLALIASRLSELSSLCGSTVLPMVAPFASAMRNSFAPSDLPNVDDPLIPGARRERHAVLGPPPAPATPCRRHPRPPRRERTRLDPLLRPALLLAGDVAQHPLVGARERG